MDEEDYDVVSVTLQKQIDILTAMDKNPYSFGIMQQIRMEQIDQLENAKLLWKQNYVKR